MEKRSEGEGDRGEGRNERGGWGNVIMCLYIIEIRLYLMILEDMGRHRKRLDLVTGEQSKGCGFC